MIHHFVMIIPKPFHILPLTQKIISFQYFLHSQESLKYLVMFTSRISRRGNIIDVVCLFVCLSESMQGNMLGGVSYPIDL